MNSVQLLQITHAFTNDMRANSLTFLILCCCFIWPRAKILCKRCSQGHANRLFSLKQSYGNSLSSVVWNKLLLNLVVLNIIAGIFTVVDLPFRIVCFFNVMNYHRLISSILEKCCRVNSHSKFSTRGTMARNQWSIFKFRRSTLAQLFRQNCCR